MSSPNKLLIAVFLACAAGTVHAFNDSGMGARASGMGNVFTAAANDGYSTYYNPAGPAIIRNVHIGTTYASYYTGLTDGSSIYEADIAVVLPDEGGGFGFYWKDTGLREFYSESTLAAAYAARLMPNLAAGASLKLRSIGYAQNDLTHFNSVFSAFTASGISADLGVLYNPFAGINVGLSFCDILQPNLGLLDENKVPLTIRAGAVYYPLSGAQRRDLLVAGDATKTGSTYILSAGAEYWAFPKLACVRGGYSRGSGGISVMAAGAGIRIDGLVPDMTVQIDYSFDIPLGYTELGGTHRFSANFILENPPKETPKEPAKAQVPTQEPKKKPSAVKTSPKPKK